MTILWATEYFHPWTPGGTAESLRLLGTELVRHGHRVVVVTPNYGFATRRDWRDSVDGIEVIRFPVRRRLTPFTAALAPIRDHVSPFFHLRMARAIVRAAKETRATVLHAQEKHALVGTWLAGLWLRLPVYLTLRDYGLICPIATCLQTRDRIPGDCSSWKLQRACAPHYMALYRPPRSRWRTRVALGLLYLDAAIKGAIVRRVRVVGVSQAVLDIYRGAGRVREGRVAYTAAPVA